MEDRERFQYEHLLHAVIREARHYGATDAEVAWHAQRIIFEMRTELKRYGIAGYGR